jgi:zinc D-Ala-D-Ala carboxypeptidase
VRYFKINEFDCQETGENWMDSDFLEMLDELRHRCDFPFVITSGYRSPEHSIENKKEKPGTHSQGIAADVRVSGGAQKHILLKEAFDMGFTGIGIANTYIHIDTRDSAPVVWTY